MACLLFPGEARDGGGQRAAFVMMPVNPDNEITRKSNWEAVTGDGEPFTLHCQFQKPGVILVRC